MLALCKLFAAKSVDNSEHCKQLYQAGAHWLIYTAFTNLICNKE